MSHARRPVTDDVITVGLRRAVVGGLLVVLAIVLGIMIAVEVDPLDIDTWWNGAVSVSAGALTQLALALNFLGGGWFATYLVPLGGCLLLALFGRWRAGLFFLSASALSAAVVQVLKTVFGRVRPEDMLVISDHGSYPSGHAANAATIAVVALVLLPRAWVAVVGGAWVFAMAFSRTQVHAHWFSDTVGGVLVGAGMALMVAGLFTVALLRESAARESLAKERSLG
jgi:membrane-associated phospholipid phosphatase